MVIIGSMPAATARCTYLARAVTPGVYVLPPARVEAMYDLNTNAICGAGGSFVVRSMGVPPMFSAMDVGATK